MSAVEPAHPLQKNSLVEGSSVLPLIQAVIRDDRAEVSRLLGLSPFLARQCIMVGATRREASEFYFQEIEHYLYAGDTPLHAAAAGYRNHIARAILEKGADVAAGNRRGAKPLHYAADGGPGSRNWNPKSQAATVALLIEAGADPNARDKSGVAPLHRAVRQRCSSAVDSLLRNGAHVHLKNGTGSTPLHLAVQNTGRGGAGSPESKICQREIIKLLLAAGADPQEQDARGTTARQRAEKDSIQQLL